MALINKLLIVGFILLCIYAIMSRIVNSRNNNKDNKNDKENKD